MSMEQSDRATLLAVVGRELGREVSARMVMFHQAIAERLGLNATDHKALDLLGRAGPITAGELAELTGLTTGAITGIIDRLEKAGFVRRENDPKDRRRVIIRPLMEKCNTTSLRSSTPWGKRRTSYARATVTRNLSSSGTS
jgi:DNA-binding transcriptional ArsR family regulator